MNADTEDFDKSNSDISEPETNSRGQKPRILKHKERTPSFYKLVGCIMLLVCGYLLLKYIYFSHEAPPVEEEKPVVDPERMGNPRQTLQEVCQETIWQKDTYLNCAQISGDVFQVKNAIMTCLRWAIDAGMGMIMPQIGIRQKQGANIWVDSYANLSYFFDADLMNQTLHKECPKLELVKSTSALKTDYKKIVTRFIEWKPYIKMTYKQHAERVIAYKLQKETNIMQNPILFEEENPLWGWHFYREPTIRKDIFEIIPFNDRLLSLAQTVRSKISDKFIAIDLRTEFNTRPHSFDEIVLWLQDEKLKKDYSDSDIYIATENYKEYEKMQKLYTNVKIISKWSLANKDQDLLENLKSLRFDELSVIDFEVLKSAEHFYGMAGSSLSYSVANERSKAFSQSCKCDLYGVVDPYFICCL